MSNYRILVLDNTQLDTKKDFLKAKSFFKEKGIEVSFFTMKVNELVSVHEYKKVQGFNNKTGQAALISYKGLDDIVKDNCRKYVKEGEYDHVMFLWDKTEQDKYLLGTEIITSWNNWKPLYPNTGFSQLAINQYMIDNDRVWLVIPHEQIHEFCRSLQAKGYPVIDEMDITIVNGQPVPFHKNDNPYALDGNYAVTLKSIKPYINKLYKVTDYFKTQEFVPKAIYQKYGENSNWFIDPRIRKLANFIRVFFNKSVTINNWAFGGKLEQRGFRTDGSVGAELSQHRYGRAIDFNVKGMTPKEVYKAILANEKLFMEQGLTTVEDVAYTQSWTHCDIRFTGLDKILIVKP